MDTAPWVPRVPELSGHIRFVLGDQDWVPVAGSARARGTGPLSLWRRWRSRDDAGDSPVRCHRRGAYEEGRRHEAHLEGRAGNSIRRSRSSALPAVAERPMALRTVRGPGAGRRHLRAGSGGLLHNPVADERELDVERVHDRRHGRCRGKDAQGRDRGDEDTWESSAHGQTTFEVETGMSGPHPR